MTFELYDLIIVSIFLLFTSKCAISTIPSYVFQKLKSDEEQIINQAKKTRRNWLNYSIFWDNASHILLSVSITSTVIILFITSTQVDLPKIIFYSSLSIFCSIQEYTLRPKSKANVYRKAYYMLNKELQNIELNKASGYAKLSLTLSKCEKIIYKTFNS